jgi:uncharacterized membrane protein
MKPRLGVILALAAIGVAVALYLLTVHWGWWQAVCLGAGDCEAVNLSRWSELFGIPVALLGALSYAAIIALCIFIARDFYTEYSRIGLFFVAVIGVAFSAYLTYAEIAWIHAICPWCVTSAILITVIAVLGGIEVRSAD